MIKRVYRVRVDLNVGCPVDGDMSEPFRATLGMLRYCGLLRSNVRGFPLIIEYDCNHSPTRDIQRWASFGFAAEEVSPS